MAISVIAVGHGATIAFGTSTFTASVRSIGGFTKERDAVDASALDTSTYMKMVPAGAASSGSFDCEFIFDAGDACDETSGKLPPINGDREAITVTFPIGDLGTAANYTGVGFVSGWSTPELTSDGLMLGSFTVQWEDGNLGGWTKGVAPE